VAALLRDLLLLLSRMTAELSARKSRASSTFAAVTECGWRGLRMGGKALVEQARLIEERVGAMRAERTSAISRLGPALPETALLPLLQQERAQLRLWGAAADAARKQRAAALRLASMRPLLMAGALPVARKESTAESLVPPAVLRDDR
jgi:hypothetical protein